MPLILIDLDNTLVDRAADYLRWVEKFVADNNLTPDFLERLVELDNDGVVVRTDFVVKVSQEMNSQLSPGEVLKHYRVHHTRSSHLESNIKNALVNLKSHGHTLAIVSNGPPHQHDVIKNTGLANLVDTWVVSDTVGISKPDRKIADVVAEKLNMQLTKGFVIGDSIVDIELAKNIDFKSIWLTRGRTWSLKEFNPHFSVNTFVEATELILNGETS